MKAHYPTWIWYSLRFVYLRFLPSPLFEWTLGISMLVSLFWIFFGALICLPFVAAPYGFKAMMGCAANRKLVRTKKGYPRLAVTRLEWVIWLFCGKAGNSHLWSREMARCRGWSVIAMFMVS